MLKESFSFDDPKSIIQSNLPISEKKLQLSSLKLEYDDKLKKLKKDKEKERPKVNLGGKITLFLLLYLITGWNIELALFIFCTIYFYHFVKFLLVGPTKKVKAAELKKTEKMVKSIDQYIKILKDV